MLIQLLLIQIGTFIALILVLRLLFYRHLNSALRRLKASQEEAFIKEAQIKEELERAKQERLAEVEKGKLEAKRLIEVAKKDAEVLRYKIEEEAKEESEKIVAYGKEQLETLRQELLSNIKTQALKLSMEMIKYTLTEKGKENLQHQLMEELIAEIEKLDREKFTVKTDKVRVSSSFNLSEMERSRLNDAFAAKLGYPVTLEEKIDSEIISGLVIQMDEFVIDGSLKNKLSKVIPYLHTELES
jgi:F0F1-type ATP synthase delta subunit